MAQNETLNASAGWLAAGARRAWCIAAIAAAIGGTECAAWGMGGAPPERAAPERTARSRFALMDAKLRLQPVELISITMTPGTPGEFKVREADGAMVSRSFGDVVALVPGWWGGDGEATAAASATEIVRPGGTLELTDGERWPGYIGEPMGPDADRDAVVWQHFRMGLLTTPIDLLKRYVSAVPAGLNANAARGQVDAGAGGDSALLRNGDRLSGVVEKFGPSMVFGAGKRGGEATTLDLTQVVEVRFNNPPAPESMARGPMVWLGDGTIARVRELSSPSRWRLLIKPARGLAFGSADPNPEHGGVDPDARSVFGFEEIVSFSPDSSRIRALSELPVEKFRPVKPLLFAEPVQVLRGAGVVTVLNAADVLLPGPMTVEWTLPKGAKRLSMLARLQDEAEAWGDCTVRAWIARDGVQDIGAATAELRADRRTARIELDLSAAAAGDRLVVTVEPGGRGPIQNRVVLSRAILLIENK